jgi:hypothetical protein
MKPTNLAAVGVLLAVGVICLPEEKDRQTVAAIGGGDAVANPHSKSIRRPAPELVRRSEWTAGIFGEENRQNGLTWRIYSLSLF